MSARRAREYELSEQDFERLLDLVDVLDEVQLLRLQCKVSSLIGDPPTVDEGLLDRDTVPPPVGLSGHYSPAARDSYEVLVDLSDVLEPEDD